MKFTRDYKTFEELNGVSLENYKEGKWKKHVNFIKIILKDALLYEKLIAIERTVHFINQKGNQCGHRNLTQINQTKIPKNNLWS